MHSGPPCRHKRQMNVPITCAFAACKIPEGTRVLIGNHTCFKYMHCTMPVMWAQ